MFIQKCDWWKSELCLEISSLLGKQSTNIVLGVWTVIIEKKHGKGLGN